LRVQGSALRIVGMRGTLYHVSVIETDHHCTQSPCGCLRSLGFRSHKLAGAQVADDAKHQCANHIPVSLAHWDVILARQCLFPAALNR